MSDIHELRPLLDRVRAGDRHSLEELLKKIRPYLHLLVRRQLEPDLRHKLGDSDIVQETLIKIRGSDSKQDFGWTASSDMAATAKKHGCKKAGILFVGHDF